MFDFQRKKTPLLCSIVICLSGLSEDSSVKNLLKLWFYNSEEKVTSQEGLTILCLSLSICWKLQINIHNLSKFAEQLWAMSWANRGKASHRIMICPLFFSWKCLQEFRARCNFNQVQTSKISVQIGRNYRGFCGDSVLLCSFSRETESPLQSVQH